MMISKLGDDLLTEVLIRSFPDPRSACRSKSVCKHWRSLISHPSFNRRFLCHHQSKKNKQPPPKLLFSCGAVSLLGSFLPMPAGFHKRRFAVFDCFKDLLLCGFGEVGDDHTNAELPRSYLLCNPFTKQWIALPLAPQRPVGQTGLFARLVCEPLVSDSFGHEHRFRVVCIYQDANSMKLDVFSSDSGEWTKEALVVEGHRRFQKNIDVVSCNGVLYVSYVRAEDVDVGLHRPLIAGFNPFRLDIPPAHVDVSPISMKRRWNISISQGALHLIVFEDTNPVLSVWRLKEDRKSWTKVCQGSLKSSEDNYQYLALYFPTLHPEKPEIVFFTHFGRDVARAVRLSSDLSKGGELECVAKLDQCFTGWKVFEPKVYCWPTPISSYQKLQVRYDGSHNCWVQSNELATPSIIGT